MIFKLWIIIFGVGINSVERGCGIDLISHFWWIIGVDAEINC